MNAAINGGIEGLDTLLIEANPTAGGQAKFSSRIENLGGFPIGVTGKKLTSDMLKQASRLGAETKLGVRVTGMSVGADGMKHLTLSDGETIDSRAVILAGGLEFKPMTFPGSDGPGVFTGDGEGLAFKAAGGDAVVVGGSNGAAQAALGAAETANHVYVVSRSPIKKGMSAYQVDALHNNPKITLIEGDEVDSMSRDAKGNPVSVHTKHGQTLPATAFGVFLGAMPKTDWLGGTGVEVDDGSQDAARHEADLPPLRGKIKTNEDFETAAPGVFAIGDMRTKGAGRVGIALGEGQQAIRHSWNYLEGLRHKAGLPSLTADALTAPDDTVMHDLIHRCFDLDKENPWFGQTVEPR
jgi:thioredoxin reductase (NADPH)